MRGLLGGHLDLEPFLTRLSQSGGGAGDSKQEGVLLACRSPDTCPVQGPTVHLHGSALPHVCLSQSASKVSGSWLPAWLWLRADLGEQAGVS